MLFATPHPIKANKIALLAAHRALYFDAATDISDAHLNSTKYLSKIKGARAWGNSPGGTENAVTLSPMSGVKDNFFYPARSARLVNTASVTGGYASYTSQQTPDAVVARYFTVSDTSNYSTWASGNPVFTGQFGRSADTSESYYWPSNCMLIFPAGMRNTNVQLQTYSSKAGSQYSRYVDSFWGTYSGYDAGFNCASLGLDALTESSPVGYVYLNTTTTPNQVASLHNTYAPLDHIAFVRTIGMVYSYSGVNQNSVTNTPANGSGDAGYTRPDGAAYPMRVAVTGKANTDDVVLTSCMMAFQVNGLKYLMRGEIGQGKDLVQTAAIPTASTAALSLTNTQLFPDKSLTQM
ncbi:hypothetical protein pEaSNUABM39_00091 [Erwinia phage pEa_SNUABM_39]|nr:hypothetical protein pEaSNUABM39_00091 [Erwinia phage pEa_SNUABM_39]